MTKTSEGEMRGFHTNFTRLGYGNRPLLIHGGT